MSLWASWLSLVAAVAALMLLLTAIALASADASDRIQAWWRAKRLAAKAFEARQADIDYLAARERHAKGGWDDAA